MHYCMLRRLLRKDSILKKKKLLLSNFKVFAVFVLPFLAVPQLGVSINVWAHNPVQSSLSQVNAHPSKSARQPICTEYPTTSIYLILFHRDQVSRRISDRTLQEHRNQGLANIAPNESPTASCLSPAKRKLTRDPSVEYPVVTPSWLLLGHVLSAALWLQLKGVAIEPIESLLAVDGCDWRYRLRFCRCRGV